MWPLYASPVTKSNQLSFAPHNKRLYSPFSLPKKAKKERPQQPLWPQAVEKIRMVSEGCSPSILIVSPTYTPPGDPQAKRSSRQKTSHSGKPFGRPETAATVMASACQRTSMGECMPANTVTLVRGKSVMVQVLGAPPLKPRQEAAPPLLGNLRLGRQGSPYTLCRQASFLDGRGRP